MKMTTSFQQTKRDTNTANNTTPTHLFPSVAIIIPAADDREDILDQPAADVPKSSRQPRPAPPRSRAPAERKRLTFSLSKPTTIWDWYEVKAGLNLQ